MYDPKKSVHEEIELLKAEVNKLKQKDDHKKGEAQPADTYAELNERQNAVLRYIKDHPNSTKQAIVDGLVGKMARLPIYKIIDELAELRIINDNPDPKNRHIRRLVVNSDSEFLSVIEKLDRFREHFKQLLQKIREKAEKEYAPTGPGRNDLKNEYFELHAMPYVVLDAILQSYIIRSTMIWPIVFEDKENILKRVTIIVFSRIINMMLYEIPRIIVEGTDYYNAIYRLQKLQGTRYLEGISTMYRRLGLYKETEPVLDDLWHINKEVQEDAYPEPRFFPWKGFENRKDDWRKYLELMEKHPNERLSTLEKMPIDGLLNKNKDKGRSQNDKEKATN